MQKQSAPKFWLKPCGFRRHQHAGIGYGKQFCHGSRIHGKSHRIFLLRLFYMIDHTLQLGKSADPAHIPDAF